MSKSKLVKQEVDRISPYELCGTLNDVANLLIEKRDMYNADIGKPIRTYWIPTTQGRFTIPGIKPCIRDDLVFVNFYLDDAEEYGDKYFAIIGEREQTTEEIEYEESILNKQKENKRAEYERLKKEFGDA